MTAARRDPAVGGKYSVQPIEVVFIGAGARGGVYGNYISRHPQEAKAVAVAEPNPIRRDRFGDALGIPAENRFESWEEVLSRPQMGQACIITTMDRLHYEPARRALEAGYHVLLEKPMSPDPRECLDLVDIAERNQRILSVCHVLRYASLFTTIKRSLDEGRIGQLITIQHNENIAWWHFAHSFVRGNWRNTAQSSPLILSKACHDTDLLRWLAGDRCMRVASFGSLSHFREENAPPGSTERCLSGCTVVDSCPFSALNLYTRLDIDWLWNAITDDRSPAARRAALATGPYGRCVYRCDNDVVDHQVVSLEFANGVTASFTLSAFTHDMSRTLKLMGTEGEIRAHLGKDEATIHRFGEAGAEAVLLPGSGSGHGGGDDGLMRSFLKQVQEGRADGLTSAQIAAEAHLISFAAEESRITGTVVDLHTFEARLRAEMSSRQAGGEEGGRQGKTI